MSQYEVLRVKPEDKKTFTDLTVKFRRKQVDLAGQMIQFFDQSGYDPLAGSFETPAEELKQLRNTLVSFIRTQEKNHIIPMSEKVDNLVLVLAEFMRDNSPGIIEDEKQTAATEQASAPASAVMEKGVSKKEYEDLLIRCEKAEKKLSRIEPDFERIKAAVSWKSTGFGKGYVLEITKGEFEEIFT